MPFSSMNKFFYFETKMLNEILDKCKTYGDKRALGHINKDETPFSGDIVFFKGKDDTPN